MRDGKPLGRNVLFKGGKSGRTDMQKNLNTLTKHRQRKPGCFIPRPATAAVAYRCDTERKTVGVGTESEVGKGKSVCMQIDQPGVTI